MDISTDESLILTGIDGENANLDVSQISGWSAMTPGWNDSFKFDLDDSVHASNLSLNPDNNFSNVAKTTVEEIFVENCCTFYNDIQNAVDDLEFEEQIQCFENRQKILTEQAKLLAESVPDLAETVQLRMQAINRAMEQLKIKQNFENAKNNCAKIQKSAPQKFREWLQKIEKELERFRIGLGENVVGSITSLQKLVSDHQIFQQQIESEGQNLLSEVKKYYNSKKFQENSQKKDRSKRTLDLLEQRLLTSWLKSLENLERISTLIRNLKESKENLNSLSEDDEPLTKRRRTLSAEIQLDFQTPFPPAFSPCSTIDSDGLLIPSSTESEFGNQEDDSESQNMPENVEQDWNFNASTKQLCDVGYSSGENSIHEAVGGLDTELKNDKIFVKTTPTKMLYRTVPLDDAGLTDEEYFKGQEKMVEIELPYFGNLSDSLVVQNSSQNNMLLDDFDQVMEMMDSDSIFVQKIDELKNGTNWREMKKKNERISIFKEKRERIRTENDESREASSEESDSGEKINISSTASSKAAAALPPIPGQRKRKIKKAVRNEKNNLNCLLSSVAMDETIYIPSNPSGLMSQSFTDSSTRRGMLSKRKLEKLRMNRSFSDHYNLNLNVNQMTNSFSSQKSTTSSIFGSVLSEFDPLMTSTMKRNGSNNLTVRRLSVDSLASTTSSGTVHETGDANYEWDEYKDPPSLPDMSDIFVPYASLENVDVDEDYQLHLAMPDPNLVNSTINKSKQNYFNIRQMIDDYSALDEEKEDIRSALRLSAKKNVSKLTAIVQGIPRSNLNREQINDLEELQKQWKWTLDELGNDEMEVEMEKDWENVKNIQNCLAEIREILKNLMEVDAKSLKIEDLEKFIFERKNLWEKLVQNKEFLEKMAKTTGNQYNNGELTVLLKNVENSLGFVGNGTDVLRESMVKYQSLGDIRQGLMDLDKKMDGFEGGNGRNLIEDVEADLNVCKIRLDALETVCTNLTMQLGDIAALNGRTKPGRQTDYWKEFREFRSEFERLKLKFSKLSTDSKKSQSNVAFLNGKFGNSVRNRKSKAKDSDTSTTLSTRNSPTRNPQKMNFVTRVGNTVRNSRIVQLLLGFTAIFILGLIFINFYLDDSPKNNWRRMFGPQLDYVNGPPPM